jgi:hypothetical protein
VLKRKIDFIKSMVLYSKKHLFIERIVEII